MNVVGRLRERWSECGRELPGFLQLRHTYAIPALITAVFVFRLLMAVAVVPPWQGPDEPQHFAFVRILTLQSSLQLEQRESAAVEGEIVQSMADHGWWAHYREPVPDPLPADFTPLVDHIYRVETAPPLYYLLAVAVLKGLGITDLIGQYYALRWLSAFLAVLTLWCAWAGTNLLFGRYVAAGATALLALDPQIALASISVNPAILVNLFGAVIWWQGARLVNGDTAVLPVVAIATAAGLGVFTKRVGASFVGMAALAGLLAGARAELFSRRRTRSLAAVVGVLMLGGVGLALLIPDELARLREHWDYVFTGSINDRARSVAFFTSFTTQLLDSAWLGAGWLKYPAPLAWTLVVRALTLAAVGGLALVVVRGDGWWPGIGAAASLVLVQIAAIYVGLYLNGYGAQGHHLFPVNDGTVDGDALDRAPRMVASRPMAGRRGCRPGDDVRARRGRLVGRHPARLFHLV